MNLGLRWEHFGLTGEAGGAQANFIQPSRTRNAGAQFIMTAGHKNSPGLSTSFTDALARDGIALVYSDKYGTGMGTIQKFNFSPRDWVCLFPYARWVVRGGFGIFYGAFENRGGYPSLGYNYPFQFEVGLSDYVKWRHFHRYAGDGIPTAPPARWRTACPAFRLIRSSELQRTGAARNPAQLPDAIYAGL